MGLRFLSAGDSHGEALYGIVDGMPAGLKLPTARLRAELRRRRAVHGRSSRQLSETDDVAIVSGIWRGTTTGAPLTIRIPNSGGKPRRGRTSTTTPRPGHADLAGCLKYGLSEIVPISERASARGTAMSVAIGAIARLLLERFDVDVLAHVLSIGGVSADPARASWSTLKSRVRRSRVRCANSKAAARMAAEIDRARAAGTTLGGSVEVIARGVPPGLGSYAEWDRRLDARLAAHLMGIPSVKAVEMGEGLNACRMRGPDSNDALLLERGRIVRRTNFAGGIEGGVSNGEDIVARIYAKPIPTAAVPTASVDLKRLKRAESPYVRSDVCAVPALCAVAEAAVVWEIAVAFLEKFGGDSVEEVQRSHKAYMDALRRRSVR